MVSDTKYGVTWNDRDVMMRNGENGNLANGGNVSNNANPEVHFKKLHKNVGQKSHFSFRKLKGNFVKRKRKRTNLPETRKRRNRSAKDHS